MKNNSDKNEKVVQTKGGFNYFENEKKALDDYLAQLASENKAKTITQAKTATIGNNNVNTKNETIVNKQNEIIVTNKLSNDNTINIPEKSQNQKVENIKLNSTRIDGSFVSSISNNVNEVVNRNALKPELKPIPQFEIKQHIPSIEKREVPMKKFDKIDLISNKVDVNSNKDTNVSTGKERISIIETNSFKSNNITGNYIISSNNSSYAKGNLSSFVPSVSSVSSKFPNVPGMTTSQGSSMNTPSAASSIHEISKVLEKKKSDILPQSSLVKNIDTACLTYQENNNTINKKEEIKAEILKNETIKEIQIATSQKQIKEKEAEKNSELISINKEKHDSSQQIKEPKLVKNTAGDNSSNLIKQNQVNPPLNASNKFETSVNNDSFKNKQEKADNANQKIEDESVKKTVENKSTENDKHIIQSIPNKTENQTLVVENFKKIDENIQSIPTPKTIIEKIGKNNYSNDEIYTTKPELNEVKELNSKPSKSKILRKYFSH